MTHLILPQLRAYAQIGGKLLGILSHFCFASLFIFSQTQKSEPIFRKEVIQYIKKCYSRMRVHYYKYNKMKVSPERLSNQKQPSLISSLYRYWQQYKVPAIFYHYNLSILALKQKAEQIAFMNKEIKLLRLGTHPYHIITDLIAAREQSLQVISNNVDCLNNTTRDQSYLEENQFQREYSLLSKNSSKNGNKFIELINNIKMYRKMTVQVVSRIHQWAKQLHHNQYKGVIQFIFKHQDYLQKILTDTREIISENQALFQNNPLLIVKREHQRTQYGLIYKYLKINEQEVKKIQHILQIITTHHAILENKRLLGMFKSTGSRKSLKQLDQFDKIYCNFNKSALGAKSYKTIQISNQGKKSRLVSNPQILSDMESSGAIYRSESTKKIQNKLEQVGRSKSQAIINQSLYQQQYIKAENFTDRIQDLTSFDISFQFETGIEKTEIYNYLRNNIFKNQNIGSEQIEPITRKIIKLKDNISFINIKVGELLVGWIAVVLNPKDQLFRRVADIIYLHKFMKVPTLQQAMINHFTSLGYGLVKQAGEIISEGQNKYRKVFNLITINWYVRNSKKDKLKRVIKDYETLKGSRLLKYYSYSTQTKYHKYCSHQESHCKIQFKFQSVARITIQGKTYFRAKCDKIDRKGQMWKIQNRLNDVHLILAQKQTILDYEKDNSFFPEEMNSFDQKDDRINYVCFPQTKNLKKYVNSNEEEMIVEKLSINQETSEVLSVDMERKSMKNCLVVDQTYVMAMVCANHQDYGKTVAIVLIK